MHHIVPRHMGGDDSPENLVELTIEEHADAHRKLYDKYGRQEDYLAWKGLEGQMSKGEILQELCALGGKRGSEKCKELGIGAFFDRGELKRKIASKAGKVSTNKESIWWSNGTDYKFCIEQPKGYFKSSAPNNVGEVTGGTKWWNNGVSHKRCIESPGDEWVIGRINKGNLGGARYRK